MVDRKQIPTELFTWIMVLPGEMAEFPVDIIQDKTKWAPALVLPGRDRPPKLHIVGDSVIVPYYEIGNEAEEAQRAIDLTTADVYCEAWRLLLAAAACNPACDGRIREVVEQKMRTQFAETFRVDPDDVTLATYERDGQVVGICEQMKESLVLTVHMGPTLFHTPHTKPACFMDCGFAVLDARVVLGGRVEN